VQYTGARWNRIRQQPLRPGCLVIRLERLSESDADDHGAGRARLRSPDGGDEARQRV